MSVLIIVGIVVIVIVIAAICTPSDRSESPSPPHPPPQTVVIREPAKRNPHKYIDKRNHRYDARNERHRNNRETYPW